MDPQPIQPDIQQIADSELSPEALDRIREQNALVRSFDRALTDMRQRSYEGKLTTPARWRRLALAPEGMDTAVFEEQLISYIEDRPHAQNGPAMGQMSAPAPLEQTLSADRWHSDEAPLPDPDVTDVVLLFGKKGIYLYSKPLLSHSFARALFLTAENDDLSTFVDVVREESRIYPRPVSILSFKNPPYLWAPSKTLEVFEQAQGEDAFADIRSCKTTAGETYFFSDRYLSEAQGRALAQWHGVDKGRNP